MLSVWVNLAKGSYQRVLWIRNVGWLLKCLFSNEQSMAEVSVEGALFSFKRNGELVVLTVTQFVTLFRCGLAVVWDADPLIAELSCL